MELELSLKKVEALKLKFGEETYLLKKSTRPEVFKYAEDVEKLVENEGAPTVTEARKLDDFHREFLKGRGLPEEVYNELDNDDIREIILYLNGNKKK